MVNLNTSAVPECSGDKVHLVVDANSIFLSQKQLLGHEPRRNDRIDFARVANLVAQRSSDALDADYLDLERGGSAESNPFYFRLRQIGFRLGLTPRSDGVAPDWRVNLDRVLARFAELRTCSCDVYYVAGRMRDEVQTALLDLAEQGRDVWLMLLGRDSGLQSYELDQFADVIDLVEIRAAGRHYYQGVSEPPRAEPEPDGPSSVSDVTSTDGDRLGAIGYALAQQAPEILEAPESDPESEIEPLAAREPELIEVPTRYLNNEREPWLLAIDVENTDGVLYEILGGRELNQETRIQWDRLREWVDAQEDIESALVIPVLQSTSPGVAGFASYLAGLGFRPLLLEPEPDCKVVDEAIIKLLDSMQTRTGNVMLVSNDGDFFEELHRLQDHPDGTERRIVVAGFVDRMSQKYRKADWIDVLDLQRDLDLFLHQLPNRYLPIRLGDFDAPALLDESGLFAEEAT